MKFKCAKCSKFKEVTGRRPYKKTKIGSKGQQCYNYQCKECVQKEEINEGFSNKI